MSSVKKPMRLPPLKALRVRNPDVKEVNPCLAVMSSVLACWASAGYTAQGCAALEQSLRACMDGPPAPKPKKSEINYHLSRMYPKIAGPRKVKK
ncbi:hypothetical protein MCOR25_009750 [Pyricularia grisea]|uniref:Small ribosomal subunit protein mS37 n=1 Tax=Pyricularia grisea TaxID=148305 RepID=A0A6P8AR05_PYRGI|nr:uncharacterized protein PgNI_11903 [Pyricularia grisea]KAI6351775.1 hypothetical protein MCOR25_009750 [Pyricularia grisea]TLD04495.1 hypothetical protein PgNI_11903 [Pyricularia grisea]